MLGISSLAASGITGGLFTTPARASDPAPRGRVPDGLRPGGELDQLIAQLADDDEFSGTVLLEHRGYTVLERSVGMANKEAGIPHGPDTIFMLGSITKMFTGVAIAQLVQTGDVAYYEKLGTYLDGFPAEIADNVTVHQMLTHTSGLGDFYNAHGYIDEAATWDSAQEMMDGTMAYIRRAEPEFTPGTEYRYSNSGWVCLGAIVERIAGSYYDYVREHVLEAAGMTSADFYTVPEWRANPAIARPYAPPAPGEERIDAIDLQGFIGLPAGGAFANARDLVRFKKALLGDDLLEPFHTQIVTTPKVPVQMEPGGPEPFFLGYAPVFGTLNDQRILGHAGGSTLGTSVNIDWFPDSDWVAVVLCNYESETRKPVVDRARDLITQQ